MAGTRTQTFTGVASIILPGTPTSLTFTGVSRIIGTPSMIFTGVAAIASGPPIPDNCQPGPDPSYVADLFFSDELSELAGS